MQVCVCACACGDAPCSDPNGEPRGPAWDDRAGMCVLGGLGGSPCSMASCMGRWPQRSLVGVAPRESRKRTASTCPSEHARCSAERLRRGEGSGIRDQGSGIRVSGLARRSAERLRRAVLCGSGLVQCARAVPVAVQWSKRQGRGGQREGQKEFKEVVKPVVVGAIHTSTQSYLQAHAVTPNWSKKTEYGQKERIIVTMVPLATRLHPRRGCLAADQSPAHSARPHTARPNTVAHQQTTRPLLPTYRPPTPHTACPHAGVHTRLHTCIHARTHSTPHRLRNRTRRRTRTYKHARKQARTRTHARTHTHAQNRPRTKPPYLISG